MKGVKILHCADLHFDSPFRDSDPSYREKRKEDLRETFGAIIDKAVNEEVDIILMAGDLFDNATVMKTTVDYVIRKLKEIPHIRVFISPGNHDPYHGKSFYKIIPWPNNVHVFQDKLEKIHIENLNTIVYGIGFGDSYERIGLIEEMKSKIDIDDSKINIMVLHGDVTAGISEYNPITIDDIGKSGMDYIALGHKHDFSGILREDDTFYAYSCNPEGRGFDECGEKGIILGTVYKNYVELNFHPISKRKYVICSVDISVCRDYEEVKSMILKASESFSREKNLFKLMLCGEVSEDFIINKELLNHKIKDDFFYVKLEDNTTISIDYEEIAGEFSLRGLYAKKMLKSIEEETESSEKEFLYKALKLGIESLTAKEVKMK